MQAELLPSASWVTTYLQKMILTVSFLYFTPPSTERKKWRMENVWDGQATKNRSESFTPNIIQWQKTFLQIKSMMALIRKISFFPLCFQQGWNKNDFIGRIILRNSWKSKSGWDHVYIERNDHMKPLSKNTYTLSSNATEMGSRRDSEVNVRLINWEVGPSPFPLCWVLVPMGWGWQWALALAFYPLAAQIVSTIIWSKQIVCNCCYQVSRAGKQEFSNPNWTHDRESPNIWRH